MADDNKSKDTPKKSGTALEAGYYNVTMTNKNGQEEGEERVYHSSTAQTLQDKGYLKVGKKIEKFKPKAAKE